METGVLREFPKTNFKKVIPLILGSFLVVAAGVGVGWLISQRITGGGSSSITSSGIKVGQKEAGIIDESTFKGDTTEGILEEGGLNGEGTHHLVREGGPSQTVYLTSTAIDLQSFVGKKVKVWGETQATKKAGWFMDVVKIKVID